MRQQAGAYTSVCECAQPCVPHCWRVHVKCGSDLFTIDRTAPSRLARLSLATRHLVGVLMVVYVHACMRAR